MSHPTVRVRLPAWHHRWLRARVPSFNFNPLPCRHVRLDVGIAPLVKALWARRIPTLGSCQGGGDRLAWVDVATSEHAEFVAAIADIAGLPARTAHGRIALDPVDVTRLAVAVAHQPL